MEMLIMMMAPVYASLIIKKKLTIEQVPPIYKDATKNYMENK